MSQRSVIIPSWLNEDFIKTVICNEESRNVSIKKYQITPAAAPGDNYISDIYRIMIEISDAKNYSLIVKCLPTTGFNLKFIRTARLFEKEILVYEKVLPLMCEVSKCNCFQFAPKCYFLRPFSVVVLDDLVHQGYKIIDRQVGLDLEHCKEALKCLAKFHALSTGLSSEITATNFGDTVYSGEGNEHARSYVANCVLSVAERVEQWSGYERFASKLRHIAASSCDRVVSLFESDCSVRVLNHGDFWTNNIMFLHTEDNKISDIKLIDFQMSRFVSPAFDILYFLYTSCQEDVRLNSVTHLLEEYCTEFTNTARRLNLSASISTASLAKDMKENEFYGFINSVMMLPAVLSGPEEAPDLENVAQGKSGMEWLSGERFRQQFQNILIEFERKGCI